MGGSGGRWCWEAEMVAGDNGWVLGGGGGVGMWRW